MLIALVRQPDYISQLFLTQAILSPHLKDPFPKYFCATHNILLDIYLSAGPFSGLSMAGTNRFSGRAAAGRASDDGRSAYSSDSASAP